MSLIQKFSCGDVVNNRYHLDVQIHEGRWGDIYRATDQIEDRPVAIRFFPTADDGPADFDRFSAHARELSGLTTAVIATPIDHGLWEDVPYLVFRWARGQNLQDRLAERGPLDVEQTVTVLSKMLEGLDRAHKSRMTHGLLRPVKIKVDDVESARPFVKIVDFQIWRFYEWSSGKSSFDQSNLSRRIVRYTAPEVLDEQRVKPMTDVYATGLIAIELLTGQPAFDDNHRVALIAQQMSDEPAPLSYEADAGEAFREFLDQLVAKDQSSRFSTAGSALKALKSGKKTFLSEPPAMEPEPEPESEPELESDFDSEPELEPDFDPEPNFDALDDSESSDVEEHDPSDDFPDFEPSSGLAEASGIIKKPKKKKKKKKKRPPSRKQAPKKKKKEQSSKKKSSVDPDEELFGRDPAEVRSLSDGQSFDDDEEDDDAGFFNDSVDFGEFYADGDPVGDDDASASPLTLDEDALDERPRYGDSDEEEDEEAIAGSIPKARGEEKIIASDSDADLIASSSVPASHPSSSKARARRALEAKKKSDPTIPLAVLAAAVVIGGGLYFFVLQPEEEEITETVEIEVEEEDVEMHLTVVHTSPPAQRILVPGRTGTMISPVELEIAENEFPIQIRARLNANNIKERTIEEPTAEIHFDFSDAED